MSPADLDVVADLAWILFLLSAAALMFTLTVGCVVFLVRRGGRLTSPKTKTKAEPKDAPKIKTASDPNETNNLRAALAQARADAEAAASTNLKLIDGINTALHVDPTLTSPGFQEGAKHVQDTLRAALKTRIDQEPHS